MNRLVTSAALVWVGTAVVLAQAGSGTRTPSQGPVALGLARRTERVSVGDAKARRTAAGSPQSPTLAAEAAKYRAWLNKNCVGCHNSRTASPPDAPVNLESASLDDVLPQAETWERVLRKLSARAMPPQGVPHPTEAEYVGFTSWLSGSLDRAWEGRNTPGRYVVHRLNRSEYANVIRDLLALDIDFSELLPSDGANYGFDNIADLAEDVAAPARAVCRRRPAHQRDGRRRSRTCGRGRPSIRSAVNSRRAATSTACRSARAAARWSATCFRPTASTSCRGVWSGEWKKATPASRGTISRNTFIITVDGAEVYSAQIGGPKDHEVQAKDMNEARVLIDTRMTGRVPVTAGPHEVGFTWKERPFERQDVWQPSLRDSQEVHMIAGLPRLKTVGVEGPYNVKGVSNTPSRERLFVCRPGVGAEEPPCAEKILTNLARRAYRRPVDGGRRRGADRVLQADARERPRLRRRHSRRRRADPVEPVVPLSHRTRSRRRSGRAPRTRSATWSSPRACRSFSGAAFRTRSC